MAGWSQRKDLGVVLRYYPQTRLPMCSGRADSFHLAGALAPIHAIKPAVLRIDTEAESRHESSYRSSERGERSPSTRRTLKTQGGRRNQEHSLETVRHKHPLTYAQLPSPPHSPRKPSFPSPAKPPFLPPCRYSKAPLSKPKWPCTTRLLWKRRLTQRSAPLVIVHFEGVVGEFMRVEPWTAGVELCVREGVERGLVAILDKYQAVLVTMLGKEQRKYLLDLLKKRFGVVFDAVYKLRKSDGTSFLLDYSQILSDFAISPHKPPSPSLHSTLILSSIGLNQEDLTYRQGLDLVCEPSVSHFRRYLWYWVHRQPCSTLAGTSGADLSVPTSSTCTGQQYLHIA